MKLDAKKLSDLFPFNWRGEVFRLEVGDPDSAPGALGVQPLMASAQICEGGLVVVRADSWDHAYSVSHEIAEYAWNFEHTPQMFAEQANILAAWHRVRS